MNILLRIKYLKTNIRYYTFSGISQALDSKLWMLWHRATQDCIKSTFNDKVQDLKNQDVHKP